LTTLAIHTHLEKKVHKKHKETPFFVFLSNSWCATKIEHTIFTIVKTRFHSLHSHSFINI